MPRASVTITGLNFGSVSRTPSASIHGDELYSAGSCTTSSWTSSSTVQCASGWGYGTAARAVVTLSNIVGTAGATFAYKGCGCNIAGSDLSAVRCVSGHKYIGHIYAGHNYIGHNYRSAVSRDLCRDSACASRTTRRKTATSATPALCMTPHRTARAATVALASGRNGLSGMLACRTRACER